MRFRQLLGLRLSAVLLQVKGDTEGVKCTTKIKYANKTHHQHPELHGWHGEETPLVAGAADFCPSSSLSSWSSYWSLLAMGDTLFSSSLLSHSPVHTWLECSEAALKVLTKATE